MKEEMATQEQQQVKSSTTACAAGQEVSWTDSAFHSRRLTQKYKILKPLDKGSFGEVSLATLITEDITTAPSSTSNSSSTSSLPTSVNNNSKTLKIVPIKKNEKVFVIKKIDKERASEQLISNEIAAGKKLVEHPGIPKFIECYHDSRYCYLVFEYFDGVNLYTFLEQRNFRPVRERTARRIFRQVLGCLIYAHKNNVCHRDLKLENVLYNAKKKEAKLIDFGLCAITPSGCHNLCNNWCGSPDYVCPEILLQKDYSGCKSDVWSLGVILYILLFGQMPYNFKERFAALQNNQTHPELELDVVRVSDSAKKLVCKMLSLDPTNRPTMEELVHDPWVVKRRKLLTLLGIHKQ